MDYAVIRSRPEVETAETRLRDQRRRQISVNIQRRIVQHKRQLHFVFATTTTMTTERRQCARFLGSLDDVVTAAAEPCCNVMDTAGL